MPDFYQSVDVQAANAFTDATALVSFGFEATSQVLLNGSDIPVEVSFDGVNVHATLRTTGPSVTISWSDHLRKALYLRRAGAGAGAKLVDVFAYTR